MANHYDVPAWAGKPPVGLHLDVMKGEKLVQKLMVDEKKCYLFGRNPQLNDFCTDHASCSRVHAALVWHKHLNRAFMVDLGSTHGTFIGTIRLEGQKPTQLPLDSKFHFGASTRIYVVRERPQTGTKQITESSDLKDKTGEELEGGLLGLPETETELDNLTEFNTAHNRRISMLGIADEEKTPTTKIRRRKSVTFNEDDEVINPEDVDPSVGRFRNLVQTTVIPGKRKKMDGIPATMGLIGNSGGTGGFHDLYSDMPEIGSTGGNTMTSTSSLLFSSVLSGKLGLPLPNPAPEVDLRPPTIQMMLQPVHMQPSEQDSNSPYEPRKKKYAKEAWPGKKNMVPSLLVPGAN